MARIFQDGFETGSPQPPGSITFGDWLGSLWQFNQTTTVALDSRHIGVQSHTVNSGHYALEMFKSSTAAHQLQVYRDLENELAEHYGRVEFYLSTHLTATNIVMPIVHFRDAGFDNVVGSLRVERTAANAVTLSLFIGNVEVASYPEAFMCDVWTRLEWRLLVDGTNGVCEVKRNGDTLLLYEGNTNPHGTGHVQYLCLGTIAAMAHTYRMFFDDVAVNDTTGEKNRDWPGRGRIVLLQPCGTGDHTDWDPSEQSANFSRHMAKEYLCSSLNLPTTNLAADAFDENGSSFWRPLGVTGEWVGFELKSPAALNRLWLGGSTSTYAPANMRIEGSHDAEVWDNLTEIFFANNGLSQAYEFENETAYRYYRLFVLTSRSGRIYLYDARFYQAPTELWATLFEVPDDEDESHSWSDSYGKKLSCQLLRMADDLGYDPALEIKAIQHLMKGKYVDGEAAVQSFVRLGTDEDSGDKKILMNAYQRTLQQIWDQNPFTGNGWTLAELDDLEIGVEHKEVE